MMNSLRTLMLILFSISSFFAFSQIGLEEKKIALRLVKNNLSAIGLSTDDFNNLEISSTYYTPSSNLRMVYLQQSFKDLPVFNQMQVLAFKNNKLVSSAGNRIRNMLQLVNNGGIPQMTAEYAVKEALAYQKIVAKKEIVSLKKVNSKFNYGNLGVSNVDITAELIWLPVDSESIRLVWQIEVAPVKTSDHLLLRVDAETNQVIDVNNYTVCEQINPFLKQPISQYFFTQSSQGSKYSEFKAKESTNQLSFTQSSQGSKDSEFNKNESTNQLINESTIFQPFNYPSTLQPFFTPSPKSQIITDATYRVIPYPAESPIHVGGNASLVTNPWLLASGNAISYKWNFDGVNYMDSTRGNNVWAQEDRDNNNGTNGNAAVSITSPPSLNIDYTPDYTQLPTIIENQRFATTNLFYWNNIMHDISYLYGFDEPSGNFQVSNQGRGGLGNDYVLADAQDAGGMNNANFTTPIDGSIPRMQLYLFNYSAPNRDADLDNGVITHEYAHGISNRLTGGPTNSSCLTNAEQGGEGWSDYFALMVTTNWATATVNDGVLPRPIGNYISGKDITGSGIRTYPYSTNMGINPWTYAMLSGSGGEVHRVGEIWCAALWDMTWEMISIDGINPNLFNPLITAGNTAALKLVIEGMRLQPCSPGFIDSRNAILKADTLLFGGKYSCVIWKAFAKRGMGINALQGSSRYITDQTADFSDNGRSAALSIAPSVLQQEEGSNITFTNTVKTGSCYGLYGYIIRDTLPANVTFISGGVYDAVNRVVSFLVNQDVGISQNYSFTVKVNNGAYYPPVRLIDESVVNNALSSFWTTSSSTSTSWMTSTTKSKTAPYSLFTPNLASISDQIIETTDPIYLPSNPPYLTFQSYVNAEPAWDGGVVEISMDYGLTWSDLGSSFLSGGYNATLSSSLNPLSGRKAFTGNSKGFIKTVIDLSDYEGQTVKFRFRFGSDASFAATGWYIDDIQIKDVSEVKIISTLFNNSNLNIVTADTVTTILKSSGCKPASIINQPDNLRLCVGYSSRLNVITTDTALIYQWQSSTDNGQHFSNITNAIDSTLLINNVTSSMNGNQYRCVINGACTNNLMSAISMLVVNDLPSAPITTPVSICEKKTATITATAAYEMTIDWFEDTVTNEVLQSGLSSGVNNYITTALSFTTTYWAVQRNLITGCISSERIPSTIMVIPNPTAPLVNGNYRCGFGTVELNASVQGEDSLFWYSDSTGDVILANTFSFTTPLINANTLYYVSSKSSEGCVSLNRSPVLATIIPIPSPPIGIGSSRCGTGSLTILSMPGLDEFVNWYTEPSGGLLLLSDLNLYTTPNITVTTNYFAESKNAFCSSASRTSVSAIVNTLPATVSTVIGASKCGPDSAKLFATATNGLTINWYSDSTTSTVLQSGTLSGINTYITPILNSTTTFWTVQKDLTTGCLSAERKVVIVMINYRPLAPSVSNASRCGAGTLLLSATMPIAPAGSVSWYSSASSGVALSNCSFYNTPNISSTRNYYVASKIIATGCVSLTRSVAIATINKVPIAPIAINASRCGIGVVNISAIPDTGQTIDWYTAANNNKVVRIGSSSFATPVIHKTTSYYVAARNKYTGCVSSTRTPVTATVSTVILPESTLLTGLNNVCPLIGAFNSMTYCITAVSGASSYIWTIPSGAIIDSGSNGLKIKVRFNSIGGNDSIVVQAYNGCLGIKKVLKLTSGGYAPALFSKLNILENEKKPMVVNIFPNPTNSVFKMKVSTLASSTLKYKIIDVMGRVITKDEIKPNKIYTIGSMLKSGTYFLDINQGNNNSVLEMMKF